ncbi:alkaline phosphatase [Trypanosoma grayi]|uniref:alkaline phosphatase n=1 Tax=Trypanosoma grayi TaxID=71804 RepID=UPI0004F42082|nr:alkaline phosphatase [Trypanosoma grayi]KEG13294.1 alkaline phosphatase [Trypanosoma grayi]
MEIHRCQKSPYFIIGIVGIISLIILGNAAACAQEGSQELSQVVFISCNRHDKDQGYWDLIAAAVDNKEPVREAKNPRGRVTGSCAAAPPVDALVWLGDVVYADKCSFLRGCTPNKDVEVMRSKFVQQRNAPEYVAFRHTCVRKRDASPKQQQGEMRRVIGVWDDHDMGKNDGGSEYTDKDVVQQFFLDFLGVNGDDPRRKQRGVYNFETVPFRALGFDAFGGGDSDPTASAVLNELRRLYDNAVCFLLLDVRYFRDPVNASLSGDMLGGEQWAWLERRLRDDIAGQNPATDRERCAVTVVGGGVQLIMDEKVSENWGAFPRSRERLFALLRRHHSERVLFVTGDVHLGEIGMDVTRDAIQTLGYPIVEATSSGLTHSAAKFIGLPTLIKMVFPTPRRVGVYVERNFGIIKLVADPRAFAALSTGTDKERRHYLEKHINVSITIRSIPKQGKEVLKLMLPLSALTYTFGCQFIQASVDPNGHVFPLKALMGKTCDELQGRNEGGRTSSSPRPYPSSTPAPIITYIMRIMQRHVWPHHTLLGVLFEVVQTVVAVALVAMLTMGLCYCCWSGRMKAKIS